MIRRDGKAFAVDAHPYMDYDFVQMNLESGVWFYEHTLNSEFKQAYIDYIAYCAKEVFKFEELELNLLIGMLDAQFAQKFKRFVKEYIGEIQRSFEESHWSKKYLLDILVKESNQEFLRERYGGVYKTAPGVREVYFRLSSTGFNWYYIIWQFVYENRDKIDDVTIVRDIASTGSGEIYRGKHGKYEHMSVEDFICESGNPVIEWEKKNPSVRKHLALGGTIKGIKDLPINPLNAKKAYELLKDEENRFPQFWQDTDFVVNKILEGAPINQVILDYLD